MSIVLKGRRFIAVARCSGDSQVEESIPRQLELARQYAADHQMTLVDEITLDGMSASQREHEPALRMLIQRRRTIGDFDTLWFFTVSRLDRLRADGERLWQAFDECEIVVATHKDGVFEGKWAWLQRQLLLDQAQGNVEEFAYQTQAGMTRAIEKGRIAHCNGTIYGIDKLYLNADREPQYVVRSLRKGIWEKFSPDGKSFGLVRKVREKDIIRFMPPHGFVEFVPGDPERVQNVILAFNRRFIDGWSTPRIARELNAKCNSAARGGKWSAGAINSMLKNPIYFYGYAWTNTTSRGIYLSRGDRGPTVFPRPRTLAARQDGEGFCKHPDVIYCERSKWKKVEQPALREYLPEPLRQLAIQNYERKEKQRASKDSESPNAAGRKSGGNRHSEKPYPLTGNLRNQDGHRMSGVSNRGYRRYIVGKLLSETGLSKGHTVTANGIERAVFAQLASVLAITEIGKLVQSHVKAVMKEMFPQGQNIEVLKARKREKEDEYTVLTHDLGKHGRRLAADRINLLENEIDELDRQIGLASGSSVVDAEAVSRAVEACRQKVVEVIANPASMLQYSRFMNKMLRVFVPRLVVHLSEPVQRLEMEVAIPSWMVFQPNTVLEAAADGSVVGSSCPRSSHHAADSLILKRCFFRRAKVGLAIEWHLEAA